MPAVPDTAAISPSCTSASTVPTTLNRLYSSAPTRMPTNSELYTSLVISASTMATSGGTRDQNVPKNGLVPSLSPLANTVIEHMAQISTTVSRSSSFFLIQNTPCTDSGTFRA